jgi:SusD family.
MKSKLYSIIGLTTILTLLFSSCSGWLDLKPESQVVLEDYWKTSSQVDQVLMSCYKGLLSKDVIQRMIVWGELRSDDMTSSASGNSDDLQKITYGDITPSNGYTSWASFYTVINYCNTVLYYAPGVVDKDENFKISDLHRVQSEALTIRALSYFYLIRAFRDVPWITEPSIDDTQNYAVPKDSEQVILHNIIEDLKTASNYAISDFGSTAQNKGRITKSAVNALLADVYLWRGDQSKNDYQSCIDACNVVLGNSNLKLEDPLAFYSQVFGTGNSNESIFELQFDATNSNSTIGSWYGTSSKSAGSIMYPSSLASTVSTTGLFCPFRYANTQTGNTESQNDIRASSFYYYTGAQYQIFKYAGLGYLSDATTPIYRLGTANWILYRLPDVILMKAEALTQLEGAANLNSARILVNETYLRSNANADSLSASRYNTKAILSDLILRERQRELMFEGKRWFDLVRYARRNSSNAEALNMINSYIQQKAPSTTVSLQPLTSVDAMFLPINAGTLKLNSALKQNPFYESTTTTTK